MNHAVVTPELTNVPRETEAPSTSDVLRELSALELALIGGGTVSGTYL